MLGLSLLGHAVSFYVLQVYYAPAVALPASPPPVRWTLLPPGSPEGAALNRWLSVADPTLATGTRAPSPDRTLAGLPPTPYVPSYAALAATGSDASPLPPLTEENAPGTGGGRLPTMFPPGPAPMPALPPAGGRPTSAPSPRHTRVEFSEDLRARLPASARGAGMTVRFTHHASTIAEVLRPTAFLVGVRPEGGGQVVFREESSGTAAADEAARAYLEALLFAPLPASDGGDFAWGRVTFHWGTDVYR